MRALAYDFSSTSTGWACGEIGGMPDYSGVINRPKGMKGDPEILQYFCDQVIAQVDKFKVGVVLCEELNHFQNAITCRMLAGIRGAAMVLLKKERGIDLLPLNVMSCRSKIKVDLTKKTTMPLKLRVMLRLSQMGFDTDNDNIADAATVLLAAGQILEINGQSVTKPPKNSPGVALSW